jgi:hypothetical protein
MLRLTLIGPLLLLLACQNEPPFIRDLKYTPNAGLVNMESTVSGSVAYTDVDNDISQSVVELITPGGMATLSPRTPIENVGQGVVGSVNFTIKFTPTVTGTWTFNVYLIDLQEHVSNKLEGIIKVN